MHRFAAVEALLMLLPAIIQGSARAERAPTEEETVAPLVMKQNCWGGIIRYLADEKKFEVEDAVCADGRFYHLEFSADLKLMEKRMVRYPLDTSD
jgi:hypothetical protein